MVQPHLRSTWELLIRAFPEGIPSEQYLLLLSLLYPHMADENLTSVIAEFAGIPQERVLNDIYDVGSKNWIAPEESAPWKELRERLEKAGFDEWTELDD